MLAVRMLVHWVVKCTLKIQPSICLIGLLGPQQTQQDIHIWERLFSDISTHQQLISCMLYCKFPLVPLDVLNFKADAQLSATIEADQEAPMLLSSP